MKSNQRLISKWSESYLDALELLYEEFNLHPDLTVAEVCEEWAECFHADSPRKAEAARSEAIREWGAGYLNTLELLYGEFNLPPTLAIEELAEEWADNFREDGKVQLAINQRQDPQTWSDYYMPTWPLQPAS